MTALFHAPRDLSFGQAWICALTPVATPRGPVEAGRLRPGDLVLGRDGHLRVRSVLRAVVADRDGAAPILLRAPYFAARCDLLVSPDQPVILRGAVVEDLFGEEAVQAEARLMVDGRTALPVAAADRLAVRGAADAVTLELDRAGAVLADGCGLAMPGLPGDGLRLLCAYEVAAYLSQRWDGSLCRVA